MKRPATAAVKLVPLAQLKPHPRNPRRHDRGENTGKVNHPAHYGSGPMEVINIIRFYKCDYDTGALVKYLLRAGKKPGEPLLDDLQKAQWHMNFLVERARAGR